MAVATVRFACGHTVPASGNEVRLVCACGNSQVVDVKAPAPKFRGHCRGPHAQFEALPAVAVALVAPVEENK